MKIYSDLTELRVDELDRLANRLASEASKNRPCAITPEETRDIIALLRAEIDRVAR